ncbi:unnamed protein product [Caenorhabditis brenneri]
MGLLSNIMSFSSIFVLLFLFLSTSYGREQSGMTAYESIRKLRECIDLVDKPEFKKTCAGKYGVEKDQCVEKFTKKMMPTLNACIERSRSNLIPLPHRDEL